MALSEIARLDLTSNYCFSIDNPNPNEIDDAYSLSDDYSTLWIHTVDISSFVVVNSIDEQIAKFKKETNYSTGIDLYSDEIRNKTSLFEGLERKALSFCIKFVKNKITTNFKLTKIINKKAMSFQDADDYFKSKSLEDKEIRENLLLLSMYANRLKEHLRYKIHPIEKNGKISFQQVVLIINTYANENVGKKFTSPLRFYNQLLLHRNIKSEL